MPDSHNNSRRFIYFCFNRNEPDRIRQVVPEHVQYWKTADLEGYTGGPFGDRTGGLISFMASSLEAAAEMILRDPFIREELIDQKWIKEWLVD